MLNAFMIVPLLMLNALPTFNRLAGSLPSLRYLTSVVVPMLAILPHSARVALSGHVLVSISMFILLSIMPEY